ncbi:uncharacterized protein MONOS_9955 [Monocercomonoides exilis]|uniref:uncharacterized protein n=1 Tax=Monocercomonoides exilis TaxID=2049356 RepID=UPI0035599FFD|nr:hypothetical protein MONOS_9955 [Monocercomonoides exilis]|eukprot:MONOS_9955.1-p1 / transcript=MONOS_9955.1 / gene=MONOS_9955 / organism=Monocercomonoides_exilis_PA203 / gene_product=unspecified product / transcript_product=unspecified product / location=Mono_scaffold00431:14123-15517(-) / protein_length=397 / sequence_SO=supercontig / SO=protein_coding / is_pseudo=false
MEDEMFELSRQFNHFARGQRCLTESYNKNRSLVQQSRTCCQRREEQVNSKKNLLLPWLDMEDSQENRLDWCDESESFNHGTATILEDETKREGGKTVGVICSSRHDVDNRCCTPGLWCNPSNRQLSVPLPSSFQSSIPQPVIQYQRDVRCPFGTQTFTLSHSQTQYPKDSSEIRQHDGCLRHQSMGSWSESPFSAEENPKDDNGMEYSTESNSSPRGKEHDSGCTLETSTRRKLRNYKRSTKRALPTAESFNRTGRLRERKKLQSYNLVWTRKSGAGGRTASRLERSGDSGASSDFSDSPLLKKDSGGTGESSDSSSSLEVPGLDPSSERDDDILHEMERFEENIEGRTRNEEVGSITPTWTLLSSKTQLAAQRREQWWNSDFRRCNVPEAIITEA